MQRWCMGLAVVFLVSAQSASADRCDGVGVRADERIAGHELSLSLVHNERSISAGRSAAATKVPVGAEVDVCFLSSRDGFVSLWSHGANNATPVRILPNEYISADDDEMGIAVRAGVRTCFSELASSRNLSLRVQRPFGQAELYLHFAERREDQIAPDDFPSIGNRDFKLARSCDGRRSGAVASRTPAAPYASKAVRYEVVQ